MKFPSNTYKRILNKLWIFGFQLTLSVSFLSVIGASPNVGMMNVASSSFVKETTSFVLPVTEGSSVEDNFLVNILPFSSSINNVEWMDSDVNGDIDKIKITFNEPVNVADDATNGMDVFVISGGVTIDDTPDYTASSVTDFDFNACNTNKWNRITSKYN